ncbi:MAG: tetratricopeptide repeat protein [Gallionellaceae bacterium]|nr:tetratricopeptide repeat protein [Gallionellaceae bacterium]
MTTLNSRIFSISKLLFVMTMVSALSACGKSKPTLEEVQKLAAAGDVSAQYDLGTRYQDSVGVPKDMVKAAEWIEKAAAQGHLQAQKDIGWIYAKGDGIPANPTKAMEWYQKAAAQGDAWAEYRVGEMYNKGLGINKDIDQARIWLEKAAIKGRADAQYAVGMIYLMDEDFYEAREYLEKAAAQSHPDAQYHLASMFASGKGLKKNPNYPLMAYAWAQVAAKQGYKGADKLRDSIHLSPPQRAEAEQWASNWKHGQLLPAP